jgi:NAD(P)-dependent dehydrogenase (short-subunit alcohol dehydrogenase family)
MNISRPARLAGKVALIMGGGTGIGAAAARLFAAEGAAGAIADIQQASASQVSEAIVAGGGQALAISVDVRNEDSVIAAVAAAVREFGKLQVLFNCVGGSLPADGPITEVDLSVWDHTMTLDVRGTLLACRHAIPHMVAAGGGSVVNMSSGAALRGSGKAHIYAAAKGAVIAVTRNLAGTYAKHNVRANAICAGRINTERIQRIYGVPGKPKAGDIDIDELLKTYPFWFGEPEDIANVALFLASDESRMITGAAIPAEGGRSAY